MSTVGDVLIVGAGPAGALTALLLARAGIAVTLLDRAAFPREKPCGDCLSAEATRLLERNDLLHTVRRAPHADLHGWRIFAPAGHSFTGTFAPPLEAVAIERALFDALLVDAARAAGADVREGERVTDILRDGDTVCGVVATTELRARHVVGADGLRSVVARRIGAIRRAPRVHKLSLTAHVDSLLPRADIGEMHVGDGICVGAAPVCSRRNRWNVTVVADAARFGRAVADDAETFFISALRQLPGLQERVATDGWEPGHHGFLASGPFDVPTRRIAFRGASLVGDAAGYFDPFTGQGVYHAMRAGELLAESLINAFARSGRMPVAALGYAAAAHALLQPQRRVQRIVDAVLRHPSTANRAIARIARSPGLAHALVQVTGDVAPVRTLFSPRIARELCRPR